MPWPEPPLHPNDPELVPDPDEDQELEDARAALAALGLGHVGQLNSQKSNRRKNTLGFAPEGGRPKSRRRKK